MDYRIIDTGTDAKTVGETSVKTAVATRLTDTEKSILQVIRRNASATQDEIAKKVGLSNSGGRYAMRRLKEKGILVRAGRIKTVRGR